MDRMTALETFVTAVDTGSLNRASRIAGVTQSAVSQQIKALENLFEQELLLRSPKGVQATETGLVVYRRAQEILSGYKGLVDDIEEQRNTISGTIRISVSSFLGKMIVGPALIDLNSRHPALDLVIKIEDRRVDVVRENYDLAVRTGVLGNTDGISRKIATVDTVLYAAPHYLEAHGTPETPDDLARLKFIQINENANPARVPLLRDGTPISVEMPVGLVTDSPELMLQAVHRGAGISRAPRIMVQDSLQDGSLVQVLPDYPVAAKDIHLIYPRRGAMGRSQRLVAETLCTALSGCPFITVVHDFAAAA